MPKHRNDTLEKFEEFKALLVRARPYISHTLVRFSEIAEHRPNSHDLRIYVDGQMYYPLEEAETLLEDMDRWINTTIKER